VEDAEKRRKRWDVGSVKYIAGHGGGWDTHET
jgi:hypothetical protein